MRPQLPHTCSTCGYTWEHGIDGSHYCADNLQKKLLEMKDESAIEITCNTCNWTWLSTETDTHTCTEVLKQRVKTLEKILQEVVDDFCDREGVDENPKDAFMQEFESISLAMILLST